MAQEEKNYSASEFIEKLKSDDFGSTSLIYTGMLKNAEDDQHLLFANNMDCSNWTEIPIDIIENIEFVQLVPCKDHKHPLVRMTIKEPTSEEAKMFASLAKSVSSSGLPSRSLSGPMMGFPGYSRDRLPTPDVLFRYSGSDARPSCWKRCMDDILSIGVRNPEHWDFWSHLAYQLCDQVCP